MNIIFLYTTLEPRNKLKKNDDLVIKNKNKNRHTYTL